jgi:ERF superfamily
MTDFPKLNLREKLHNIYKEIDHIDKAGTNKNQGYKFVRAADVAHALRNAFVKYRVYAEVEDFEYLDSHTITTSKGGVMFSALVKVRGVFHDVDSDETKKFCGLGDGADSGDKGIYKAQTGAMKNALRNAFLIPDEADPEADESVDEAINYEESPKPRIREHYEPEPPPFETFEPGGEVVAELKADDTLKLAVGGELPTDQELEGYRKKFQALTEPLVEGGLKPSPNLPVARKALRYLEKVTGVEVGKITTTQWDSFFQFTDKLLATEGGNKKLAKLIEPAKA